MNKIAIISCVWQRPKELEHTLKLLSIQDDLNFDLHLICNNKKWHDLVKEHTEKDYPFEVFATYNDENRGPFARLEKMVELRYEYDWFMTIDDDAEFTYNLVSTWGKHGNQQKLMGWAGHKFLKGKWYWSKMRVKAGESCHYIWGSNLFVHSSAIKSDLVNLEETYWQCDDLWLSYYCNHILGMQIEAVHVPKFEINIDGKDTYTSQIEIKAEFLDKLRATGWDV
jgi:hypothetical protein